MFAELSVGIFEGLGCCGVCEGLNGLQGWLYGGDVTWWQVDEFLSTLRQSSWSQKAFIHPRIYTIPNKPKSATSANMSHEPTFLMVVKDMAKVSPP